MENPRGSLSLPLVPGANSSSQVWRASSLSQIWQPAGAEKDEEQVVQSEREWASVSVRRSRIGFLPRPLTALPYRFEYMHNIPQNPIQPIFSGCRQLYSLWLTLSDLVRHSLDLTIGA
jgi:hypothetical protein